MTAQTQPFLRNLWYYALPSAELKTGKMVDKILLGEPIVFLRSSDGKVSAMRNICPHRAMPLSYGKFDGCEVECCYHGWRFNTSGHCTFIPSLVGHEGMEPDNIRVRSYPVRESQGGIWIFMEDPKIKTNELPPVPFVPDIPDMQGPTVCETMRFSCFIDHAAIGLLDPAHGPFVHQSWWWRSKRSIHEKAKAFTPSHLGFTMKRHKPSSNSKIYKLLGGTPETEISFQLPGVRIEHIRAGKNIVGNMTCVTPIDETATEITNCIYTTLGWLKLLKPIAQIFAHGFLAQDRRAVEMQQHGLKHEQNLMLIRDADAQGRWYQQIRNEFSRAQAEERPFNNPVKETVLRWRT